MFNHIFNLMAVKNQVTKNGDLKNLYHRLVNFTKGNNSGLTVELISEIEDIVQKWTKDFLNRLKKVKADLQKEQESKQAA